MNTENYAIDWKTMSAKNIEPSSGRFLYIKWKIYSEGLVHLLYAIQSAICYCVKENMGRAVIIDRDVILAKKHSPEYQNEFWDIRQYFNLPQQIHFEQNEPVNIYFDYDDIFLKDYFKKSIERQEQIGIYKHNFVEVPSDIYKPNVSEIKQLSNFRDFDEFKVAFSSYKMLIWWSPWLYLDFSQIPEIQNITFTSEIYKQTLELKNQICGKYLFEKQDNCTLLGKEGHSYTAPNSCTVIYGSPSSGRYLMKKLEEGETAVFSNKYFKSNPCIKGPKRGFLVKNPSVPFYCLHLRLGDMLNGSPDKYYYQLKEYSTIQNVVKVVNENLKEDGCIYLMTNGTKEYIEELKVNLSKRFSVLTKDSFEELVMLHKQDNYKLFTMEWCLAETADCIISNRYWGGLFKNPNLIKIGPTEGIKYPGYTFN